MQWICHLPGPTAQIHILCHLRQAWFCHGSHRLKAEYRDSLAYAHINSMLETWRRHHRLLIRECWGHKLLLQHPPRENVNTHQEKGKESSQACWQTQAQFKEQPGQSPQETQVCGRHKGDGNKCEESTSTRTNREGRAHQTLSSSQ